MRPTFVLVVLALALCVGCSSDPNNPLPDASTPDPDTSAPDAAGDDVANGDAATPDATADAAPSFCATANCSGETPQCSELLGRCVGCTANNDCVTAPLLTCETLGDGAGGEPLFECVECVDDTVCAGGTCDLATHQCVN